MTRPNFKQTKISMGCKLCDFSLACFLNHLSKFSSCTSSNPRPYSPTVTEFIISIDLNLKKEIEPLIDLIARFNPPEFAMFNDIKKMLIKLSEVQIHHKLMTLLQSI